MIVAIGRELGAGGRDVGERVARGIGAELLDKEIVNHVAARVGAPASYVEQRDEAVEGFVDRLFRAISSSNPESYPGGGVPDWSEDRLVRLTGDIIREHAREGRSLVVIGRGAPVLLKDRDDVLRVFVTAPLETRILRWAQRSNVSMEEASRAVKASDQHRRAYMQQYYAVEWRDPVLYDIVVNTGRLNFDRAARTIVALVAERATR